MGSVLLLPAKRTWARDFDFSEPHFPHSSSESQIIVHGKGKEENEEDRNSSKSSRRVGAAGCGVTLYRDREDWEKI